MRRKNKSHSLGRLSPSEQAALVFQGVESGPHRVRAGRDKHGLVQRHFRDETEARRFCGLAWSHGERGSGQRPAFLFLTWATSHTALQLAQPLAPLLRMVGSLGAGQR